MAAGNAQMLLSASLALINIISWQAPISVSSAALLSRLVFPAQIQSLVTNALQNTTSQQGHATAVLRPSMDALPATALATASSAQQILTSSTAALCVLHVHLPFPTA